MPTRPLFCLLVLAASVCACAASVEPSSPSEARSFLLTIREVSRDDLDPGVHARVEEDLRGRTVRLDLVTEGAVPQVLADTAEVAPVALDLLVSDEALVLASPEGAAQLEVAPWRYDTGNPIDPTWRHSTRIPRVSFAAGRVGEDGLVLPDHATFIATTTPRRRPASMSPDVHFFSVEIKGVMDVVTLD